MVAEHTFILYNNAGEVYRGKLIEAEDNMNSQMASVTVTFRLGLHNLINYVVTVGT